MGLIFYFCWKIPGVLKCIQIAKIQLPPPSPKFVNFRRRIRKPNMDPYGHNLDKYKYFMKYNFLYLIIYIELNKFSAV